jgi:hypothetical protein
MVLVIELLCAIGIAAYGIGIAASGLANLIDALTQVPWGAVYDWLQSTPTMQIAPQIGLGNEALYAQFQQLMDTQFQIGELKRMILTMPALPSEGF